METKATRAAKTRAHHAVCQPLAEMFLLTTRPEKAKATVYVVGRPSRKHVTGFLNIPISPALKERLAAQIVGSVAIGRFASVGASGTGAAGDLP